MVNDQFSLLCISYIYIYLSIYSQTCITYILLKNAKLDNWIQNTSKVHAVGFWDKTKRQNEKNDNRRKETKDKKTKQQQQIKRQSNKKD